MQTVELPEAVSQVFGTKAASDFVVWLEERFHNVGLLSGVQISAFVARQKVNVLLLERVGNLFLADEPTLVQTTGANWAWRVPVDLTYPSRGRVGPVGEINVDARYGEVSYNDALLTEITAAAKQLTQEIPPQQYA